MRRDYFFLSGRLPGKWRSWCFVFLVLVAFPLQGQVFQPHVDNVFVDPGGSARWNVLSNG
ncbi:MAG: hypothetical protein LUG18_15785 [Candidatus Azobacteroides sp.]|nr:hypothetical protein [Candidatus Azobacteroides sp.]